MQPDKYRSNFMTVRHFLMNKIFHIKYYISFILAIKFSGFVSVLAFQSLLLTGCTVGAPANESALLFSTFIAQKGSDYGKSTAIDGNGNVYITGTVSVPSKDSDKPDEIDYDIFIAKLSSNGAKLEYLTYIGGSKADYANDITVDVAGNVYVVGNTNSLDFPLTAPVQELHRGKVDAFVLRLNLAGNVTFATYLGGKNNDKANGIALDESGAVYVTGQTNSMDFPVSQEAYQSAVNPTGGDVYVTKIDLSNSVILYSTYLGGKLLDVANDIAVDSGGNAYITGFTSSAGFPVVNPLQASKGSPLTSSPDAFITKINSNGSSIVYSTFIGGSRADKGSSIAVSQDGSAYITGSTFSSDFPTSNALQAVKAGKLDAFVAKIDPGGAAFVYSTFWGGSSSDLGNDLEIDESGNVYVVGSTGSLDFPVVNPFQAGFAGGSRDAFITKLSSDGEALLYSSYYGGAFFDESMGVAVNKTGDVYVTGRTSSTGFPLLNTRNDAYGGGASDTFVGKISGGV